MVGPERETVAEVETGAAEEYSGGCRYVQSRDERRGGWPACFLTEGKLRGPRLASRFGRAERGRP